MYGYICYMSVEVLMNFRFHSLFDHFLITGEDAE